MTLSQIVSTGLLFQIYANHAYFAAMDNPIAHFEIFDGSDIIRVEVIGITSNPSIDHRGKIWLETIVKAKGCTFSGQFSAQFMPVDFYKFRQQLISLIYSLDNTAIFEGTEGYLTIKFLVEPNDYINVKVKACDLPGIGGELSYGVYMEKSNIGDLVKQLDQILELYHTT